MTARNDWVAHLRLYSLKELRRRQDLINLQITLAYDSKKTRGLTDLQNMADSLTEAIYLNEFAYNEKGP